MSTPSDLYLDKTDPAVWRAMNGFSLKVREATDAAGLPHSAVELMNVRVSQINGCVFCLDLHHRLALTAGVTAQQLAVLPAWRESALFDEVERAALEVGEATTTTYGTAGLHTSRPDGLTDAQYTALAWAAIAINAYNQVSIISNHPVRRR